MFGAFRWVNDRKAGIVYYYVVCASITVVCIHFQVDVSNRIVLCFMALELSELIIFFNDQ